MADQTIKLESDSGSHERVALDLMKMVINYAKGEHTKDADALLSLYKRCRVATY